MNHHLWKTCGVIGLVAWMLLQGSLAAQPPREEAKAPPRSGLRVALLTAQKSDAARTVQDLATVQVSADEGVIVLERAAIERLLQEQKLSLSGFVDASTAVKAGKILAVDLIGVIEVAPDEPA